MTRRRYGNRVIALPPRQTIVDAAKKILTAAARAVRRRNIPVGPGHEAEQKQWVDANYVGFGGCGGLVEPFDLPVTVTQVRGGAAMPLEVQVLLRPQKTPILFPGGSLSTDYGARPPRTAISIIINMAHPAMDLLVREPHQKEFVDAITSMLVHELTHARDVIPGLGGARYQPDKDRAKYYNSPHEVRAYMQGVVDEVVEAVREQPGLQEKMRAWRHPNQRLIEDMLDKSFTWQQIEPHLTDVNKNRILKALYQKLAETGALFDRPAHLPRPGRVWRTPEEETLAAEFQRAAASGEFRRSRRGRG